MEKIKFGVIGCGSVAPTYLYTLQQNENAEVIALADPDSTNLSSLGEKFGIGNRYADYQEMTKNEGLDAVVIASPHHMHHDQALFCANLGLDILCEKPLATNRHDLTEMLEKTKDVRFGVMLQRRVYPNTVAAREAVQSGVLGEIQSASMTFKCQKSPEFYENWRGKAISGGGVLISQALHRLDQLVHIFGDPLFVSGKTETTRDYIEVEDYAKGHVIFNNARVEIEANNSAGIEGYKSIIEINGLDGRIILSDDDVLQWNVPGLNQPRKLDQNEIPAQHRPIHYGPGHELVIDDFVYSIVEDRQPMLTGQDALGCMNIVFEFYESAKKGGAIISLK